VIGYARVSTIGQTLEQQTEALTAAGAGKIFHDVMSGARDDRPGFTECMRYLREGDTLIVWRLDRLGRNMRAIINTVHELTQGGVTVRSLHDGVDTSTSTGRMVAGRWVVAHRPPRLGRSNICERVAEEFATAASGQFVEEDDHARQLVAGQVMAHVVLERLLIEIRVLLPDDERAQLRAPLWVVDGQRGGLYDFGVTADDVLDLGWECFRLPSSRRRGP
jgi:hypothetical protein